LFVMEVAKKVKVVCGSSGGTSSTMDGCAGRNREKKNVTAGSKAL